MSAAAASDAGSHARIARILLEARHRHPRSALARLERAFAQYAGLRAPIRAPHPAQRPTWYFPGLDSDPWPDPARCPGLAEVEARSTEIIAEVRAALADPEALRVWNDGTPHQGSWQSLVVRYGSRSIPAAAERLPVTTQTLAELPGIGEMAMVSVLGPGAHIQPHCGLHNFRWTAHLGIDVPDGDLGFRVADAVRRWQVGRCLLFDDSFEHEAWNRSSERRVVLLFDLWHPDLTALERELLDRIAHELASLRSRV
jgi:hypothetical protein